MVCSETWSHGIKLCHNQLFLMKFVGELLFEEDINDFLFIYVNCIITKSQILVKIWLLITFIHHIIYNLKIVLKNWYFSQSICFIRVINLTVLCLDIVLLTTKSEWNIKSQGKLLKLIIWGKQKYNTIMCEI